MMNRAYSLLEVKQVDDDARIIVGTATTPSPDRVGDIVEPLGVKFKNPPSKIEAMIQEAVLAELEAASKHAAESV